MRTFWSDLRFSLRMLRKSPAFAVVAVLTAALGIGANAAVFSIVNAVLIRALPFTDPDRLYALSETHPQVSKLDVAYQDFLDWKARSRVFQQMAVFSRFTPTYVLYEDGQPEELHAMAAAPDFFPMLGVRPLLGHTFTSSEDREGANHYALLSENLWRRRFRSDPAIGGRSIHLNGELYTVAGVLSEESAYPPGTDLWLPFTNVDQANRENRMYHAASVIARLAPGVTRERAQREIAAIAQGLEREYPRSNRTIGVALEPLREEYAGNIRVTLLVVFGAVGLVLLMACANIANLLLARATGRQNETSVRIALGATRSRLIRQFLTESLVLGILGGLTGTLFAHWLTPLLRTLVADSGAAQMPGLSGLETDPGMLAFAVALSILTGLLFGILPSVRLSRVNVNDSLKQQSRSSVGGRRSVSSALVAAEAAIAVVVLIGAGLLLRSFERLLQVDPGIRTDHLLAAQLNLAGAHYEGGKPIAEFYQRLIERLQQIPGVTRVAAINSIPLRGRGNLTRFAIEGQPRPEPGRFPVAQIRVVSPGYFETTGMRLVAGRLFTAADLADSNKGAFVINESLARRYSPGKNPVGENVLMGVTGPKLQPVPVVGVVADAKDLGVDAAAEPELYTVGFSRGAFVMIRTLTAPLSMASAVRREVLAIDRGQPVAKFESMDEVLSSSLARRRLSSVLLGSFSLVALALAAIGNFGLVSYSVSQRTRELGVRIALGARPRDLLGMLVRQGLAPAGVGLAIGLLAAFAVTRVLQTLLFGVSALDPVTFTAVPLLLLATTLLAVSIPARRAARVDPMTALRSE